MVDITLTGLAAVQDRLSALPVALQEALLAKSEALAQALADNVRDEKLSGQVLTERSGRLKDSITGNVSESDGVVSGSVSADDNVPYAAIQEYGGTTKAHIIEATNGKVLAFQSQGKQMFLRRVQHPGSVIPERSYLRSSLDDMRGDILQEMLNALSDTIEP